MLAQLASETFSYQSFPVSEYFRCILFNDQGKQREVELKRRSLGAFPVKLGCEPLNFKRPTWQYNAEACEAKI